LSNCAKAPELSRQPVTPLEDHYCQIAKLRSLYNETA
jgi:hypothetical protein